MRRRRIIDTEDNKDRWLVSYADFITLLFVVFVVMYAVSNINLEYYKDLLEQSNLALDDNVSMTKKKSNAEAMSQQLAELRKKLKKRRAAFAEYVKGKHQLKRLNKELKASLQTEIQEKGVIINKHEDWMSIELKSLFPSASVIPRERAHFIVEKIAYALNRLDNKISVQGHTDNVPISNSVFPSNWELSAARAAAVVRLLQDSGVNPKRMTAIGFGQTYPIARNTSAAGRKRNRRIVILLALDREVLNELQSALPDYVKPGSSAKLPSTGNDDIDAKHIKYQLGDHELPDGGISPSQ